MSQAVSEATYRVAKEGGARMNNDAFGPEYEIHTIYCMKIDTVPVNEQTPTDKVLLVTERDAAYNWLKYVEVERQDLLSVAEYS